MKHKDFETRAELLRAAADSIEMQEKAGVEPLMRNIYGYALPISLSGCNRLSHEFPLAVVEGKQVWEGDELWRTDLVNKKTIITASNISSLLPYLSWNPPKPKTVMVELPVDVMECWSKYEAMPTLAKACRKALEELK